LRTWIKFHVCMEGREWISGYFGLAQRLGNVGGCWRSVGWFGSHFVFLSVLTIEVNHDGSHEAASLIPREIKNRPCVPA
jgi:hypothetical protein